MEVTLAAVVVCDSEEVVVPELLDEEFAVLVDEFGVVAFGGGVVLLLGVLGHFALGILDAVAFGDVVVFEVHADLVRDVDDLLHGHVEALGHVDQVEAVHFALDGLDFALLFVNLV